MTTTSSSGVTDPVTFEIIRHKLTQVIEEVLRGEHDGDGFVVVDGLIGNINVERPLIPE